MSYLVAEISMNFLTINLPNFEQVKHYQQSRPTLLCWKPFFSFNILWIRKV